MHDADEMSSSSLQHAAGSGWIKLVGQLPRKELPRVVVDHRMQVQARSIKEPNERDVHVPELIGLSRANPLFGLRRVETKPRAKPPMSKDLPSPRARRREYAPDSLSVKRQRTDRKVPKVLTTNHVPHNTQLAIGQLRRSRLGATASVIQMTRSRATPRMVAGGREAHESQCGVSGDQSTCSLHGGKQPLLTCSVRNTSRIETHPCYTRKNEQKPNDGLERLVPLAQIEHLGA